MLQETAFNPITRRLKSIESTLHQHRQRGEEKTEKPSSKANDDDYDNGGGGGEGTYHQQQQQQLKLPIRAFRPRRLSFSTPPVDIKQNIIDSINSGDYTALDSDEDDGGGGGGGGGAKAHRARNLAEESLMNTWISMILYQESTFVKCMKMMNTRKLIISMVYDWIPPLKNSKLEIPNWILLVQMFT
nr:unnamed protein product [Callosobruchus analis]